MSRVLIVDDDPQLLRALRINLVARHHDVQVATTGADALQLAAIHLPDLVLLDLGLPDLDGVDVIHGLRGWTDVPIIVLSGRSGGRTRWPHSTRGPTTMSPSRSASRSCWPGCGRWPVAGPVLRAVTPSSGSATCRSTWSTGP